MIENEAEIADKAKEPAPIKRWSELLAEKNGAWTFPTFFKFEEAVRAFDVKPGDVWICSVPKSGTTWMQELVWLLTHNLDFESANTLLRYRSPGIESCWSCNFFGFPAVPLSEFERLASLSGGRRVLKTHLHYDFLPDKVRDPNSVAKIISVARNPKDACISYYYFHLFYDKYREYNFTLDDFCDSYIKGDFVYGPYWRHVKGFWNRRHDPNVLFVKYEDMKKDLKKVVREVATFLGEPIPNEDQMKKLLQHLHFDSMKYNMILNTDDGEHQLRNNGINADNRCTRNGTIGDWQFKLTPERLKQFDEWIEENTKNTDLTFDENL